MSESWWTPKQYARRRPLLDIRAKVLRSVREHFWDQGFVEVQTPALQVSPGVDRHIRPIRGVVRGAFDSSAVERFLHTSPEFSMKKLLAAGEDKIFQICQVYRDGEEGHLHHPEFTMLEWYRAGETQDALIHDVKSLVDAACTASKSNLLRHEGKSADPRTDWICMTVADAFETFANIDILGLMDDPVRPSIAAFAAEVFAAGIRCAATDKWDDVFNRVMLERVEPALAPGPPALLTDFPTPVGALARQKPEDPRVCERVEAYICGVELANGFAELTDPIEQRERFGRDIADYEGLYGKAPPIDEDFLKALEHMPEAVGMALGIDRLVMLLTGADDIRDVLWAPVDLTSQ